MSRKTIRGTTQIAAFAATFSALMQRVHSAFHRKLPGRIWVSIFLAGFHHSPFSLPVHTAYFASKARIFVFLYSAWFMISQSVLECKPIQRKKFPKCIDNPFFGCYDKEKFERKEPSTMKNVNTTTNIRSSAPWYAQLA